MGKSEKIKNLFLQKKELSVTEIVNELNISKKYIHRVLNNLLESNEIIKIGTAPKTVYKLNENDVLIKVINLDKFNDEKIQFLDSNFLMITEIGQILNGLEGFQNWCQKRNLPLEKTINEFILTKEKYNKYKDKNGLLSGLEKLKNTKGYDKIYMDELLYLDFYAIESFGKTRLGTILHYAKQGQN